MNETPKRSRHSAHLFEPHLDHVISSETQHTCFALDSRATSPSSWLVLVYKMTHSTAGSNSWRYPRTRSSSKAHLGVYGSFPATKMYATDNIADEIRQWCHLLPERGVSASEKLKNPLMLQPLSCGPQKQRVLTTA